MPLRKVQLPKDNIEDKELERTPVPFVNRFRDVQLSRYGVYAYMHKSTGDIAYIGKDSNMNNYTRKSLHETKKLQYVDRVIQKAPKLYEFMIIGIFSDKDWMEDTEKSLIAQCKADGQCVLNVEDTYGE